MEAVKKHKWIRDEKGDIDVWQFEEGEYHNGPRCEVCNFGFCHHCYTAGYDTECDTDADLSTFDDYKLDKGLLEETRKIKEKYGRSNK